jgi:hypothetical protein
LQWIIKIPEFNEFSGIEEVAAMVHFRMDVVKESRLVMHTKADRAAKVSHHYEIIERLDICFSDGR